MQIAGDVRWQGDAHTAPGQFLGSTYLFSTTWVVLAAMTAAPVVPVFCRPDGRGRYLLEFLPSFRVPADAPGTARTPSTSSGPSTPSPSRSAATPTRATTTSPGPSPTSPSPRWPERSGLPCLGAGADRPRPFEPGSGLSRTGTGGGGWDAPIGIAKRWSPGLRPALARSWLDSWAWRSGTSSTSPRPARTEFPKVVRPFYNPWPPAAYRLAEPGDTLDRVGLYLASADLGAGVPGDRPPENPDAGASASRPTSRLWPAALALSPGRDLARLDPGPDRSMAGMGLGWRTIFDPSTATVRAVRSGLAAVSPFSSSGCDHLEFPGDETDGFPCL